MKLYNMGDGQHHNSLLGINLLIIIDVAGLLFFGYHFEKFMYVLGIFIFVFPVLVVAEIYFLVGFIKQKIALSGTKKMGQINRLYSTIKRINAFEEYDIKYYIEYIYVNDYDEECVCKVRLYDSDYKLLSNAIEIPIYVKGKYSLFKIEEVREYLSNPENLINSCE